MLKGICERRGFQTSLNNYSSKTLKFDEKNIENFKTNLLKRVYLNKFFQKNGSQVKFKDRVQALQQKHKENK